MSEEDRNRGMFKTAGEPEEEDANSKVTKGLYVDSPVGDIVTSFEPLMNGGSGKGNKGFNPGITNQQNTRLKETGTAKNISYSEEETISNISEQDHKDIEKNHNELGFEQNKFGLVERNKINFNKVLFCEEDMESLLCFSSKNSVSDQHQDLFRISISDRFFSLKSVTSVSVVPTKYYGIGVDMRSSTNTNKHCVKHRFFLLPLNEQYFKVLIKLIGLRFWTKVIPSCGVFYIIDSRTIEQNWNIWGVFKQKGLLLKWAIFAYYNDENSDMSEKVDSPDFSGLDLLKFNGENCEFNNVKNIVNMRGKSENNEQSIYEEKSFVSNETENNEKISKSYCKNFAATKEQQRCGIPKKSKKVAGRQRLTRISKHAKKSRKSRIRLVRKYLQSCTQNDSVLGTVVYNYTDIPETDNFMFPTNNQDSNRRSRQEHGQPQRSSAQQHSTLESDTPGRVSDDVRDPPGQQSIYIPPGDNRLEQYRLSTFEHYPISSPTTRKSLAKAGFYFTGFFDRVKCFACARTVERWNNTDIPSDVRWHKESCPFPRGEDCGNVPIRSLFGGINIGGASAQWNSRQNEQVLEQRDPITGAITRVVRFPADLPERVRQTGGSFRIGPNNTVHIQNGPGTTRGRLPGVQQAPMPPNQWRMANVISSDHRRFLTNLHLNRELDSTDGKRNIWNSMETLKGCNVDKTIIYDRLKIQEKGNEKKDMVPPPLNPNNGSVAQPNIAPAPGIRGYLERYETYFDIPIYKRCPSLHLEQLARIGFKFIKPDPGQAGRIICTDCGKLHSFTDIIRRSPKNFVWHENGCSFENKRFPCDHCENLNVHEQDWEWCNKCGQDILPVKAFSELEQHLQMIPEQQAQQNHAFISCLVCNQDVDSRQNVDTCTVCGGPLCICYGYHNH
uniref:uncharacterized protein LOC120334376 n=1 Tax=Styela clava TaxID=7725 RepID=UPI001939C564|nr:uncharacterized protein LOC120334376 [Styela clava]